MLYRHISRGGRKGAPRVKNPAWPARCAGRRLLRESATHSGMCRIQVKPPTCAATTSAAAEMAEHAPTPTHPARQGSSATHRSEAMPWSQTRDDCTHTGRLLQAKIGVLLLLLLPLACCTESTMSNNAAAAEHPECCGTRWKELWML